MFSERMWIRVYFRVGGLYLGFLRPAEQSRGIRDAFDGILVT